MSLINALFPDQIVINTSREAIVDALALSIVCDQRADPVELEQGAGFIIGLLGVDAQQARELLADSFQRIAELDNTEAFIASIASRLPDQATREAALFAAAYIQYVDGEIAQEEELLLGLLSEAFGVDEARTSQIIQEVELQLEEAYRVEGEDA